MKKLLLIYIISLFALQNTYSQEWFPLGAKWTYAYFNVIGPYSSNYPVKYFVKKDTVVKGKACKEISDGSFRYHENGLVYYFNPPIDTSWNLLFDFTKSVGDTIFYPQYREVAISGDTVTYYNIVDSIFQVILNNDTLKGYTCWYDAFLWGWGHFGFKPIAIERVSGGDLYYEFDYWPSGPIGLRCYEDSILGLYKSPGFSLDCDTTVSNVGLESTLDPGLINIYPNPAKDGITIQTEFENSNELIFRLFDLNGSLLIQSQIEESKVMIDISNLKSGMYIYEIESSEGTFRNKLIIE